MSSNTPVLLLVGSGAQRFREYILRSVSTRYRLWLFGSHEATWEKPYIVGSTVVNTLDAEATVAAARTLAEEVPFAGVLCYDELSLVPAAGAARALGLPGSSPEAIAACRDKHRGRRLLTDAGVAQPASVAVSTLEEALEAAASIGYPVVIKPRALAGGNGVIRIDGPDGLKEHFAVTAQANFGDSTRYKEHGVLVEECMTGPEISIDAVYQGGAVVPLALARKQLGFAPSFEETGHTVDAQDPLLADAALFGMLAEAHRALGLDHLVTHTEVRLTPNGPRIVEINARLGGDLIPYIAGLANGIDAALAAADACSGTPVAAQREASGHAAIRMLYPPHDLEFAGIEVDRSGLPPEIHEISPAVDPGTRLRLPPRDHASRSRYGYAIATGADEESCRRALDRVEELATVNGTPLS